MYKDQIQSYFDWFRNQLNKICSLESRNFRKLLMVTTLDTLARAYRPHELNNKERFKSLVRDLGEWQEQDRVSLPQLAYRIEKLPSLGTSDLAKAVEDRLSTWMSGHTIRLNADAPPDELLPFAQCSKEQNLIHESTHLNLFYEYRCLLVHEFREPGYSIEVTGEDDDQPYYIGMIHPDETNTWELTYPVAFFRRTTLAVIEGLEAKFVSDDVNPYAAYDFGSVWVHKKGAKPATSH